MSALVIGLVYKFFPGKGAVFTVALALADHAHDDGTHIYPGVDSLVTKTRLNRRTVQRALRSLEESGWLLVDKPATGRRGYATVYRINPLWIETGVMPLSYDPATGDSMPPHDGELSTAAGAALSTAGAALSTYRAAIDRPNHQEPDCAAGYIHNALAVDNWQPSAAALRDVCKIDPLLDVDGVLLEFRAYWRTRAQALPAAVWDLKFIQRAQHLDNLQQEQWGGPKAVQFTRRDASETGGDS